MSYKFIEDLFGDDLSIVEIEALKPIASSYTMAILQPAEDLYADDFVVRNENQVSAITKYNMFFEKVYADNIQLALSPEYSCPWESLVLAINNTFPKLGSLWVIGCESITFNELNALKEANSDVSFFYEHIEEIEGRNFLDPVVYCFNARDNNNCIKKVVVVQFKQVHMVDHGTELERDHMIKGTVRYVLRNNVNSTYLTALICAEAISFDFNDLPNHDFLIPHIQLNTKPYSDSYMGYRTETFKYRNNIEYICVNWAEGFKINGYHPSEYGGSAIYLKSDKINSDDRRLNANHKKGIYYFYAYGQQYHIYNLNYGQHLFYLKNSQILQNTAPLISQRRQGIEAYGTYLWDNDWVECDYPCDDKWKSYLEDNGFWEAINFLEPYEPLTRDRFLSITSGQILSKKEWYKAEHLESCRVNLEEISKSFSDFCDPRNGQNFNEVIAKINWLKRDVLLDPDVPYPAKFTMLRPINDFVVHERNVESHINITSENNGYPATFVGLGETTEPQAKKVFDNIASSIGIAGFRLIVWYKNLSGEIKYLYNSGEPSIDYSSIESPVSFAREGI